MWHQLLPHGERRARGVEPRAGFFGRPPYQDNLPSTFPTLHYFLIADNLSRLPLSRGHVVQVCAGCDLSKLLIFNCDAAPKSG
jgi:hypothetical protein